MMVILNVINRFVDILDDPDPRLQAPGLCEALARAFGSRLVALGIPPGDGAPFAADEWPGLRM